MISADNLSKEEKDKIKKWKKAIDESDSQISYRGEDIRNSMTWRF